MDERELPKAIGDLVEPFFDGSSGSDGRVKLRLAPASGGCQRDNTESAEERRERLGQRLLAAWHTVPKGFRWARFGKVALGERVRPRTAVEVASKLPVCSSVLLIGPSGAGKTSLAAALVRRAIEAAKQAIDTGDGSAYKLGAGACFLTAYDLAKAGIYSPLGSCPQLVTKALQASLLVIDDLGMDVEVYAKSATSVREVIHERHARQRCTVVTTYLNREHMVCHYGEGITRRLESGATILLGAGGAKP